MPSSCGFCVVLTRMFRDVWYCAAFQRMCEHDILRSMCLSFIADVQLSCIKGPYILQQFSGFKVRQVVIDVIATELLSLWLWLWYHLHSGWNVVTIPVTCLAYWWHFITVVSAGKDGMWHKLPITFIVINTWAGVSPSVSSSPCHYHSTDVLCLYFIYLLWSLKILAIDIIVR
jgi:hypothetical protein